MIENRGNRPLPLGERCEAALFDSVDMVSAMVTGLAKAPSKSVQDRVESWLGEWAARHAGTLVVTREPMVLKPGQRVAASATFHLPKDLRPLGHFRTNLQLYNATLDVEIYTTRKEEASATA